VRSEGTGTLRTVSTVFASSTVLGVDPTEYLAKVVKYDSVCGFLFTGYFLHYFPFFLMSRQLFLHHYFPALYFAILLSCAVFDFATSALKPKFRLQIAAILAIVAIWNFSKFSPLAYGNPWTRKQCASAQWLKTWDFAWWAVSLGDADRR
jgi:dolichyl-phosphate-mannose-protein mannosyltransferase